MAGTEEWVNGKLAGTLGEVLIRCNNVLYVRALPEESLSEAEIKEKKQIEEGYDEEEIPQ